MFGKLNEIAVGSVLFLIAVVSHAQVDMVGALKSESCKKVGLAAATATNLRDNGATEEVALAVMNAGIPESDATRAKLPVIVKSVYEHNELSMHSHRMYRWVECANQTLGKSMKGLEVLAPELKKCQALSSPQTQIDCMASVSNGS
ncbi:hypothetical protein PPN31114_02964 [Pandoraea pneumonica]|jgi:hypothetical protein|uniref:Uncharacterized protein n=1 Tax=Pandoraea pneumonica TaxID=2508299 RepID=A0A5E4W0X8_9BURK|nr:hypothetical protein [Pandoraea pneumonica]VVE17204.1 hypothetical protein PPN31114_02964 [Pandoraea pneumonica]